MTGYLADHGLELVSAGASCAAAVVAVLVYRRQSAGDDQVSWLVERDKNGRIYIVRSGGGVALDVAWTFDDAATMRTVYPPSGDPAEPEQRIPVGGAHPRSDYIVPGRITLTWKQKRLVRTTSHTWSSRLP